MPDLEQSAHYRKQENTLFRNEYCNNLVSRMTKVTCDLSHTADKSIPGEISDLNKEGDRYNLYKTGVYKLGRNFLKHRAQKAFTTRKEWIKMWSCIHTYTHIYIMESYAA